MKRCVNCNSEVSDDARFCPVCGRSLNTYCSNCHSIVPSGARFCPKCGTKLINHYENSTKECQKCQKIHFPGIEPCIIVVVEKEGKILLARHIHRNQDIYACVAGFIEAGESAEQAVERELFEETGIKVKNVTYRGSQSWPFPDQLMLGFTAEYQSGEINIQKEEIADAQFFDPNNLPPIPKEG